MRFTRIAIVVFATIGLILGLMPSATAGHKDGAHEDQPTPPLVGRNVKAACEVHGSVTIDLGVDLTPRHNHYRFLSTRIDCTGTPDPNYTIVNAQVDARGGTDGPCQPHTAPPTPTGCPGGPTTPLYHGETDAAGWSHRDGYSGFAGGDFCDGSNGNANKGDISVLSVKPARGWVKFVRVGVAVTAWGHLNWDDPSQKKNDCFLAELVFTPTGTFPPVTTANLDGTAVIYN